MAGSYLVHKELGETPLAALERVRIREEIGADVPMTYAGRLDPAAEGILVILVGAECKNKEAYLGLSKTYIAEILFGVATDTYDLLGVPREGLSAVWGSEMIQKEAVAFLQKTLGTHSQAYPAYSSKTVGGVQLHTLARSGTVTETPVHDVTLEKYSVLSMREIKSEEVLDRVHTIATLVQGDFRQEDIIASWDTYAFEKETLYILKIELEVSSGFYIRQLAEDIGKAVGVPACLYSLRRTQVGDFA